MDAPPHAAAGALGDPADVGPAPLPVPLRVHLAHAVVQAVADQAGVDVLHIKGPAAAAIRGERRSNDADVLVRPEQANLFLEALTAHGWSEVTRLASGGLIEHSTNWYHPQLGQLDAHVRFPGIRLATPDAFEVLWAQRGEHQIAHQVCPVPGTTHHRLLLLIHAARNRGARDEEASGIWSPLSPEEQGSVWEAARQLQAEVALAAAVGGLEAFKDRPEYTFWAMSSARIDTPPGPVRFFAKLRAAPTSAPHRFRGVIGYVRSVVHKTQEGALSDAGGSPTVEARIGGLAAWLRHWFKPGPKRRTVR